MNNFKNLEKYTCVKVYLRGFSEPVSFENDNFKMERDSENKQIIITNSKSQLIIFEDCLLGILMSR